MNVSFSRKCLAALIVLGLSASGCAGVLSSVGSAMSAPAQKAENPLNGEELSATRSPGGADLMQMTAADCTQWPISDRYLLKATPEKVCVDFYLHANMAPQYLAFYVATDSGKSDVLKVEVKDAEMRKIGHCARREGPSSDVWESHGKACAPNVALLTPQSKHLAIRTNKGVFGDVDIAAWDLTQ
jgi:hypothetical protein